MDASTEDDTTEQLSLSRGAVHRPVGDQRRELLILPGGSGKASHRRYPLGRVLKNTSESAVCGERNWEGRGRGDS